MDLFKSLVDISSENGKIHEFYEFSNNVHKMIGCEKAEYEISLF